MRIALIDHSYHKTTGSTQFFCDIAEQLGTVRYFYDETWCGGANSWRAEFNERDYDLIIVWQAHEALDLISDAHDNVVFIPMYDAMLQGERFFWKREFMARKCISFSRKLHQEITSRNGISVYFKYFPDPSRYEPVSDFSAIRPLFWYRTEEVNTDLVLDLCRGTKIAELSIHNAPDPNQPNLKLQRLPDNVAAVHVTSWFDNAIEYQATLLKHNVFFAPRRLEGIGMAFLEAMASGLCVVAPNAPTMNEYISNGTNGLLYPLAHASALDFSRAREIGARARETIERGFAAWQRSLPDLAEFLATPNKHLSTKLGSAPRLACHHGKIDASSRAVGKVSVVTVCLNAADTLERTITSVLHQDRANVEYIILDGGSSDGSLQIIERFADLLAHWQSEPDDGVYDCMNKAIERCSGDWILFMNAGDTFSDSDSLSRMFRAVSDDMDVVYGHHLYVPVGGVPEYHPAADFELTWKRLKAGDLGFDWLAGIPGHQATAVRRELLAKLRFDTKLRIAADHDLLFRARQSGANFFNCDELVSVYAGGGMSAMNYAVCKQEWAQLAIKYGDPDGARRFYARLDAADTAHAAGWSKFLKAIISRWGQGLKAFRPLDVKASRVHDGRSSSNAIIEGGRTLPANEHPVGAE